MNTILRALVVVAAVTLAGTAFAGVPGSGAQPAPRSARVDHPPVSQLTGTPTARPTSAPAAPPSPRPTDPTPLRGVTIALDPGHQLGNAGHPAQIGRLVPAGGLRKPCNTTGTATNSGVPESTVNWLVARAVQAQLEALGAHVPMTRTGDLPDMWGPCVHTRGRFGERVGARLMVSLHADGATSEDHGFHVIAPQSRVPWTSDIAGASLGLAESLRDALAASGIPPANYVGGGSGLVVREDLGTLNLSDVPVAMIEMGNLRNDEDARRLTTTGGQASYVAAIVRGIRTYLGL